MPFPRLVLIEASEQFFPVEACEWTSISAWILRGVCDLDIAWQGRTVVMQADEPFFGLEGI